MNNCRVSWAGKMLKFYFCEKQREEPARKELAVQMSRVLRLFQQGGKNGAVKWVCSPLKLARFSGSKATPIPNNTRRISVCYKISNNQTGTGKTSKRNKKSQNFCAVEKFTLRVILNSNYRREHTRNYKSFIQFLHSFFLPFLEYRIYETINNKIL